MSERIAYEEVPGSRTTQQAIDQPQRERIAYEELQPGDIIQEGDEWRSECGRWQQFVLTQAKPYQVRCSLRVRRPYKISTILEIGDAIARAQKAATQLQEAATQLQDERDELKTALRECGAAHKVTMEQGLQACKDRDAACKERDLARAEVARLSTELWARKPLEDRIASLTHELANAAVDGYNLQHERDETRAELKRLQDESDNLKTALRESQVTREAAIAERNEAERLSAEAQMQRDKAWSDQKAIQACRDTALQELAQAREASQQLLQTITDNLDQFADAGKMLEQQRDEARAERDRLQEVVGNLYNEPTARQVQQMLRTWATELDWSAGCFGSFGRSQIDIIQQTMVAVIQRIETMLNPEGGIDGE